MPKIVDHEQYRKELLNQCFDLFAENGYGSITMRQLAEGLKVSTGTLYHYFSSKQAIFEQMVWERLSHDIREFGKQLQPVMDLKEQVQLIFQHFKRNEDQGFKEMALYLEYYQHQKRECRSENILQKVLETIIPEIQAVLHFEDPQIQQFIFSIIDGLIYARVYGCEVDWDAQGELIGELLSMYQRTHLKPPQ
jgi:AcrR family transcriptional regulator